MKNQVIVNLVLDKSGSMSSVTAATISGVNEYIQTLQKDKKADYKLAVTLFDTEVENFYSGDIKKAPEFDRKNYRPGGMTALYDAVCRSIVELKVAKKNKVITVIMTDGEENSSKEYTQSQLKTIIKEKEKEGNWTFVFLGANQDAWLNASKFGFSAQNVSNFNATQKGVNMVYSTLAANTVAYAARAMKNTTEFFSGKDQQDLSTTK